MKFYHNWETNATLGLDSWCGGFKGKWETTPNFQTTCWFPDIWWLLDILKNIGDVLLFLLYKHSTSNFFAGARCYTEPARRGTRKCPPLPFKDSVQSDSDLHPPGLSFIPVLAKSSHWRCRIRAKSSFHKSLRESDCHNGMRWSKRNMCGSDPRMNQPQLTNKSVSSG